MTVHALAHRGVYDVLDRRPALAEQGRDMPAASIRVVGMPCIPAMSAGAVCTVATGFVHGTPTYSEGS